MSVYVTYQIYLSIFLKLFNEHICVINGWMQLLVGVYPLPIKINSCQIAPCVPINYTIWVQHWYDLEYKVISEYPCPYTRANEIVNYPLDHK